MSDIFFEDEWWRPSTAIDLCLICGGVSIVSAFVLLLLWRGYKTFKEKVSTLFEMDELLVLEVSSTSEGQSSFSPIR